MAEILKDLDTANYSKLREAFHRGNLIIIPTETVYGIAADATNSIAVEKIFKAKNRPADNPLIIHFYDKQHITEFVDLDFSPLEEMIVDELMPGSVTLIKDFKTSTICPLALCNKPNICIRMPSHEVTRKLISELGKPLAAPSANKSGKPSCTTAIDCRTEFKNDTEVEYIVDAGPCKYGLESTIVKVEGNIIKILRKGAITAEDIKTKLVDCKVEYASPEAQTVVPGTKYKHYSPKAEVYVVNGKDKEDTALKFEQLMTRIVDHHILICVFEELFNDYAPSDSLPTFGDLKFVSCVIGKVFFLNLGNRDNLIDLGKYLYKILRTADEQNIAEIYFEHVDNKGLGVTIAERLSKASNNKTI